MRVRSNVLNAFCLAAALSLFSSRALAHEIDGNLEDATGDSQVWSTPYNDFHVVDAHGQRHRVKIGKDLLQQLGGIDGVRKWRGQRVRVSVNDSSANATVPEASGVAALGGTTAAAAPQALVSGSKPWLAILVRFGDNNSTPYAKNWFEQRLTTPNQFMDKIWREDSYDIINVNGSQVAGWYTLPHPRSYYVYDNNGDGQEDADLGRIGDDAIALADPDVYFPAFSGVQVMLNDGIGCCAWGGARNINADGVDRSYSFTWMPPWAYEQLGVLAHEMGHGFGLPHSSGPYGQTYDSKWDFMSSAYGDNPPHTISYHKNKLGWIPDSRVFTPAVGSTQDIFLERTAFPGNAPGTWGMAKIPLPNNLFYTVESRHRIGYDNAIPQEGVVLHTVDTTRASHAWVVDPDGNGDCNDAGAAWTPGETFTDAANQISVQVLSTSATGDWVRIAYKANATATPTPVPANGNGVCASYWGNQTLAGSPCAMRSEAQLAFNWGQGGPAGTACGTLTDHFSARVTAALEAPYAGQYTLYLTGDDGIRLWATNPATGVESLLIDKWVDQSATESNAVLPFNLNAGQRTNLRAEYYENGGDAVFSLSWSGPNVPKQLVPQNRLYSAACALPTSTPTLTSTWTSSSTSTSTRTWTRTSTNTATSTATATATPTATWTSSSTATNTSTQTPVTPGVTVTTAVPTATPTFSSTATKTWTPTWTSTWTSSFTNTSTKTNTPVPPTNTFTNSATKTNTPVPPTATYTATKTNTPVPPANTLALKHRNVDTAASSGSPYPQFQLTNIGGAPEQLQGLEIRYWFTADGATALQAWLDWTNAMGVVVDLVTTNVGGQTHYLRVRFTQAYTLAAGASVEVHTRFNRSDWGSLNQANDWSFLAQSSYTSWDHVTLYRNGSKLWGTEPTGAIAASLGGAQSLIAGPNPAKDELLVAYQGSNAHLRLALYNLAGDLVITQDLGQPGTGEQNSQLRVSGLATGLYLLGLEESMGSGWKRQNLFKVVVQR